MNIQLSNLVPTPEGHLTVDVTIDAEKTYSIIIPDFKTRTGPDEDFLKRNSEEIIAFLLRGFVRRYLAQNPSATLSQIRNAVIAQTFTI